MTILQDFFLMILLEILMTVKKTLKETVIENIFFSSVNIINYRVLIDNRKFYDQPVNDQIKKYEEVRKIATGQRDNYATGCLLDYQYFKDDEQLIAVDLSKQKS